MAGWIKLHRGITENFLWSGEPFTKGQAWIDLLLHANFTDNKIQIKSQVVDLKRGDQARSELTLAKEWKWSRNKVRRFLDTLKKEGMITTKTGHLTSVISICNYESFQGDDTTDGTADGTPNDTTEGHLTGHSKECKKGKNENNGKNKPLSVKKFTDDDMKTAEYIFKLIQHLDPDHKIPNMDKWADTIRLMRERDNRTHLEICQVFKWANHDSFWATNILSPSKLRDQYDKLKIKMNMPTQQSGMSFQQKADIAQAGFLDDDAIEGEFTRG